MNEQLQLHRINVRSLYGPRNTNSWFSNVHVALGADSWVFVTQDIFGQVRTCHILQTKPRIKRGLVLLRMART